MKQFLKYTLASILGVFISFTLLFVAFIIFISIIITGLQTQKVVDIPANSIIELKLNYTVPDRTYQSFSAITSFPFVSTKKQLGLNDILDNIQKAKRDYKVKGIYLNLNNFIGGGIATVEAIRRELIDFRKSGKFVVAFGDNISQKAYYLATAANKIYMVPQGLMEFKGLSSEMMFFKNTLDKLEIEPQIFQVGAYKSATEPFKTDRMSDANKLQLAELLSSVNNHMLREIETARKISFDSLKLISNNLLVRFPEAAWKMKFIDSLIYKDQVIESIKKMAKIDQKKKINLTSIEDYANVEDENKASSRQRIAVIYAVGEINNTTGNETTIGIENVADAIRKAKDDERVKAIVMRVNSPGGDALTSDIIWREVFIAKMKKPFIVSMGNVAASGGYYISCAADEIIAEPNTITGSIGVYGIIPNFKNFFKNKLGITFDRITTGKYSDFYNLNRPLTADEKKIVQSEVDRIYDTFVRKVAEGRKKTYNEIHKIGQGRVWSGLEAKENGLVDEIGGLNDAVKIAARKAKVKDYSIVEYPEQRSLLKTIMEDFSADTKLSLLKLNLGENYKFYEQLQQINNLKGMQARMPYQLDIY